MLHLLHPQPAAKYLWQGRNGWVRTGKKVRAVMDTGFDYIIVGAQARPVACWPIG
jgi:hypothetical protein